ncbi:hypothetical protein CCP3SC15_1610001 [Gammaproteobacteria bacterium]
MKAIAELIKYIRVLDDRIEELETKVENGG